MFKIDAETDEKITYKDMIEQSIRCALWLRKENIGKDDIISICTNNRMNAYIPILATFYEGAINNAWHHEITLSKIYNIIFFHIILKY